MPTTSPKCIRWLKGNGAASVVSTRHIWYGQWNILFCLVFHVMQVWVENGKCVWCAGTNATPEWVCSKPSQRAGRIGHIVWYLMIWIQFLSLKMLYDLQMLMFVQERPSSKYACSSSNLRKLIDASMNLSLEKDWHVRRQTKGAIVMVHAAKAMEHNMTVKRQFAQLNM